MSIFLRFLWLLATARWRKPFGINGISRLRQRVWLDDLDFNIHMNNARYLAVMDLGRVDWIIRSGAWRLIRHAGMRPVVGGYMVRFRRSLRPFQRFELRTRLLGWDERWIYIEQIMESRDGIACLVVQRSGFTRKGRLVPPAELAEKLDYHGPILPAPDWVSAWHDSEKAFVRESEMAQLDVSHRGEP
jgi:acyl-CoA thioesterase FadM